MSLRDPVGAEAAQGCLAVLNAGSSSIKFAVYDPAAKLAPMFHGQIEAIGVKPHMKVADARGETVAERSWPSADLDHDSATRQILETAIGLLRGRKVTSIGHRVVHGGTRFAGPAVVDAGVIEALAALIPLAPLHQPHNLAPIRAIAKAAAHIRQVACFDTAFHRAQDPLVQLFAIPRALTEAGVRRYGFHGLSYEFVSGRLCTLAPEIAAGRVIIGHLGNGASLCAVREGRSVANTMGFTAVDGLMMGTRCGAIDPGVLLYLLDERGMSPRDVQDLIYKESGLLGVSGISSDMRTLRASDAPAAREAIALFVHRIVREIGSLAAALGGLDAIVFTAGIGEHDAATRAEVMAGCAWLGVVADEARNRAGQGRISADGARVSAWVVPTDEEAMIAQHTADVLERAA
ncbi:MAG TPA: acetate/propionate family kinase [Acetobacteraceae bacterium]|nr:acetate/propionate family kinase [Acetobacteraceae bacterium]